MFSNHKKHVLTFHVLLYCSYKGDKDRKSKDVTQLLPRNNSGAYMKGSCQDARTNIAGFTSFFDYLSLSQSCYLSFCCCVHFCLQLSFIVPKLLSFFLLMCSLLSTIIFHCPKVVIFLSAAERETYLALIMSELS